MDETAKFPHALFLRDEAAGLPFYFFASSEVQSRLDQCLVLSPAAGVERCMATRDHGDDSEARRALRERKASTPEG